MTNETEPAEVRSNDGLCMLDDDEADPVRLWAEIHRLRAAVQGPDGFATWQEAATAERVRRVRAEDAEALRRNLDIALAMLAEWCVAVDVNGTGWDDWDEHYKDAMYRPGPLREQLDAAIAEARKQRQLMALHNA